MTKLSVNIQLLLGFMLVFKKKSMSAINPSLGIFSEMFVIHALKLNFWHDHLILCSDLMAQD